MNVLGHVLTLYQLQINGLADPGTIASTMPLLILLVAVNCLIILKKMCIRDRVADSVSIDHVIAAGIGDGIDNAGDPVRAAFFAGRVVAIATESCVVGILPVRDDPGHARQTASRGGRRQQARSRGKIGEEILGFLDVGKIWGVAGIPDLRSLLQAKMLN